MFQNESCIDFTIPSERTAFQQALDELSNEAASGLSAAPIVGGRQVKTGHSIASVDPSSGTELGRVWLAGEEQAAEALASLREAKAAWSRTPAEQRAAILDQAASLLAADRRRLAALIIREAGKPWREADADVVEAIDFCRYYADEMRRLGKAQRTAVVLAEENFYLYKPRGIAVVISPWNFPLAIACGMLTAALVAGNVAVLKPAEQSSLIAAELVKILLRAGIPEQALAYLPGVGEVVGRALVESALVDMICFTGSRAVGLEIIKSAAEVRPGQQTIKKVVAELGGKNAIIIDEDADLDEAIKGVISSAFGYAGQKCSACSRVLAVGSAYEPFMQRLTAAANDLIVGPAAEPSTTVGPVIDAESQERILAVIEGAEKTRPAAFKGRAPERGSFVPPTIFADVPKQSPLWREEIFGPVLACRKAKTFADALEEANDSEYALTGGLYSRSPAHIKQAAEEFMVGNLYINRSCTGAIVCRQPFGGFRMSGVGSKAGGPDYLQQFMEPRTITENSMRRGFTPELA